MLRLLRERLLRAVQAAFPAELLALAAPAGLTPLVELIGGVGPVVPTDGLAPRSRGLPRPAIAVNLHGSGPESHRLLILFAGWSSLVHGAVMAIDAVRTAGERGHLVGDVPALVAAGALVLLLAPPVASGDAS